MNMHLLNRRRFLQASATLAAVSVVPAANAMVREPQAKPDSDELAGLDALGQAELVRQKKISPAELVDAAIARIEKHDPALNTIITPTFERARKQAAQPVGSGPFAGVPYLVKDLEPVAGVRQTFGAGAFKGNVALYTSEVIQRMERAGLIMLGKSNTPEFGLLPVTEPRAFGATRNPWNTAHSPGGSSGGAAAAVAAGLVPIATASDGGGSIRIPASCCGLFGLKISRGRNPEFPGVKDDGLSVNHCVARSVRDSAALLDATRGPTVGERWYAPPPTRPYLQEVGAPPGRLRIAFMTKNFAGALVHPDCIKAVEATAKLCEELGHTVEEAVPQFDGRLFGESFLVLWAAVAGRAVKTAKKLSGGKVTVEAFEPWTRKLVEMDAKYAPSDVSLVWTGIAQQANLAMVKFLTKYDVLLTPTLGRPPVKIGELDQNMPVDKLIPWLNEYVPFTPLANATGQPAMSVPLHWNADGLPIGSHFFGRHTDEVTLLRLAAQFEQARPWTKRRPPAVAAR
ncbi:MAG TPA: amidase family protein [Planctomycetaceae bacterium]|jgi:amidase|nr:amidase family protein [Planctomycetaceae bacterium]